MRNKMKLYKKNLRYFKEEKTDIYSFIKDCSLSDITFSQTEEGFIIKTGSNIYVEDIKTESLLFSNLSLFFFSRSTKRIKPERLHTLKTCRKS